MTCQWAEWGASNDPPRRGISWTSKPEQDAGEVDFGLSGVVSVRIVPAGKFVQGFTERF